MITATYNVWNCCGGHRIADIAADIAASGADVVGIQELDRGSPRSGGIFVLEALSRASGYGYYSYHPALPWGGYPFEGEYGIGILSKYPIGNAETVRLPYGIYEPRVFARAVIELPDGPLDFFNTHLSLKSPELRAEQFALIRAAAAGRDYILTGDFNVSSMAEYSAFGGDWVNAGFESYIGSDECFRCIDNIFYSPAFSLISKEMKKTSASDHNMVLAAFERKEKHV